ncbi:hypothetical protein A2U01_0038418, partial [Trifolium medium]|nr:hypothetical protein [Trifolium medium]
MAPGTQTARETATTETTKMEDEDEIHRTQVPVTTEAAGTTPTKTSEEGSPTVIPLQECWLFDRGKTPGKHILTGVLGGAGALGMHLVANCLQRFYPCQICEG